MTGTFFAVTSTAVLASNLRSSSVRFSDSARCRLTHSDDALCRSRNSITRANLSTSISLAVVNGVTGTSMIPGGIVFRGSRCDMVRIPVYLASPADGICGDLDQGHAPADG